MWLDERLPRGSDADFDGRGHQHATARRTVLPRHPVVAVGGGHRAVGGHGHEVVAAARIHHPSLCAPAPAAAPIYGRGR